MPPGYAVRFRRNAEKNWNASLPGGMNSSPTVFLQRSQNNLTKHQFVNLFQFFPIPFPL